MRWFREGVPQADGTRKETTMMSIYFGSRNGEVVVKKVHDRAMDDVLEKLGWLRTSGGSFRLFEDRYYVGAQPFIGDNAQSQG